MVFVSTLAVEWIEIRCPIHPHICIRVSTLAVEWIEIISTIQANFAVAGLHPRGGVD